MLSIVTLNDIMLDVTTLSIMILSIDKVNVVQYFRYAECQVPLHRMSSC
jgi:hypothetical protein